MKIALQNTKQYDALLKLSSYNTLDTIKCDINILKEILEKIKYHSEKRQKLFEKLSVISSHNEIIKNSTGNEDQSERDEDENEKNGEHAYISCYNHLMLSLYIISTKFFLEIPLDKQYYEHQELINQSSPQSLQHNHYRCDLNH